MATRSLNLLALLLAGLALSPGLAEAQKRCAKGIPCGNTCISASKTCRVGSGSATKAPTSQSTPASKAAPVIPEGTQYVASSMGTVYYWVGCNGWKHLATANLVFFKTADEAKKAGYRQSLQAECAGPPSEPKVPGPGGG
jgi:hypothetical protein